MSKSASEKSKRKKSSNHSNGKPKQKRPTLAEQADKFACYLASVQTADHEVDFFEQVFRDAYGRRPFSLREDFCGTFAVCCEWVKSRKKRTAVAVDLCPETLDWGRQHHLAKLTGHERRRVAVLEADVRVPGSEPVDIVAAQNFSFWLFKRRPELLEYLQAAHANLDREGVMVLDMMGGGACYEEGNVDKRKIGKGKKAFRYEWEQASFDPITRDALCYIHFQFQDGSRLDRAFEYNWRTWTIPEVRDALAEAGFRESHVYWEIEDEDGEDTGEWERATRAENADAWVGYIVAVK